MKKTNRKWKPRRLVAGFLLIYYLISPCEAAKTPEEIIINKLNKNFAKIKDARADFTLDTGLQIFGCGGLQRQTGKLWFKAPDKVKVELDQVRYFIKGNFIRRIDADGKRYYVRLLHAPDFTPGFNPKIITHNFNLKAIKETTNEIILEGLPKPGVLKNVKRVSFYIEPNNCWEPQEFLLRKMIFSLQQNLSGNAYILYEKMGKLSVPVATHGKTALEVNNGTLVGFTFNLKGKNVRINTGLSDKIFDPGF